MTNPTETHESVLAEMRRYLAQSNPSSDRLKRAPPSWMTVNHWVNRLAAAHEREVGELYARRARQIEGRFSERARAEAAEALLREARNWIDNDTDEVAAVIARIDARIGATNG